MKKKMFTLWMTGLFLLLTTLGAAAQNSGTTGPLNWNYDTGTKTLTITGTGAMPDFANADAQPWKDVRNEIEKVKIEAGVKSVGAYAFRNSAALTSVTLPAGVQTIGEAAFNDCAALTSVTLPEGLTTIGKYAFSGCSALTSITLPGSVTAIGEQALGNCTALTDITVGWAAPLGIDANVFHPSVTLQNIKLHVPAGLTKAYRGKDVWKTFGKITDGTITNSPLDATQTWWEYDDATRTLTVSGTGAMPDFNSFDDQPWKGVREKIKTVVIGAGVTSIGNEAFTGCEALTSVTLPESGFETIGKRAFMGCEKLSSITIPKSVTTIGEQAFYSCYALGGVTVGWTEAGSIPNLPASAFSYPKGKVLHVPAGTAEIYKAKDEWKKFFIMDGKTAGGNLSTGLHWAYNDETKTLSITGQGEIPDYNYPNEQPWCAFGGKAQTLTLAEGVTKIGERAFAEFHVLPSITLPKSVATIGQNAFENCHKLTDVTVPWTDNNIPIPDGNAFDLPGLVLHVPAGTVETYKTKDVWKRFFIMDGKTAGGDLSTGLHWAFNNETKTLSITGQGEIPEYNNSEDQPWHAFWVKVQTVTLGEGITKIGKRALCELRKMTSITIPKSVTEIGEEAFASSKSLTNFTVAWKDAGSIPDIQANVFNDVTLSDVTLYVPEGMVDTYKAKNVWKDFDIQETPPILSAALTDAAPMAWTAGSTKQIKVQGNKKWKAAIPAAAQTWLEFAGGDGITIVSESPDTTLTVKAKNANGITAARTATLDFVFEDGSGPATPVTVAVTQEAFSPTFSVTPATLTFTFDGEDKALTVTANRPWTAQCDASWITLSAASGTGNGTITVTAPAYEDEQPRTAKIFFASGTLKKTITVTQNPKPGPAFVALDYTELTLPVGASQRLIVTAYPKDADINRDVKWYSSNNDIATVSANGTVTALAPGRADITVVANVGGQQTACRVRVVPVEQMVSVTPGSDNTLRLALVAPSDADFTLSFDVDLPEGFALDAKKTAPDASLAASYTLTVTGKRVEMKPNGLRSGGTMEKRNLLTFACTAAPGTSKGTYKAALRNLTFTPTAGYALQNITVPFTFTYTVANETIDGLRVYAADGALRLTLPKAATVHIYNVVGSLVRTMNASAGDHVLPLSSGMYVVRVGERVTKILIK
ncbi:Bacterial Ig-like domain (group 2), BspA homologue [Tannerella forsythia]|uniref:leucine-rich repeat protein n=1 Tax=Tannerella forsythia TaxID=28112 RepID=UPI00086F615E|nr:leucine-rich repeat protein [Tannerella forsythia]SCQ21478.1 Bacterial Ig-like domain (group 2), BspA homologue [Tannerella forsythia]